MCGSSRKSARGPRGKDNSDGAEHDFLRRSHPTHPNCRINEAVTALIDEAEQASTEDEQTEKLRAANEQIAADAASAWLYLYPQIVVARSNVSGYGVNGLNSQFFVSGISKN